MRTQTVALPDVTGLDVEDAKQTLRAAAHAHRSRRPVGEREQLGEQWVQTALEFLGDAQTVACYVSVNEEPPTPALCEAIASSGRRLLLPKLGPTLAREWAWYLGAEDLRVGAPGRPPEPSGPSMDAKILADVDALIIPALLVDQEGHRLGQGGGWYDRVLKQINPSAKVGAMVFPDEYVDVSLPQEAMDRGVSFVILPDEWFATDVPAL